MQPQLSIQISFAFAVLSGSIFWLVFVSVDPGNQHRTLLVGAAAIVMLVAACIIERQARPRQQWLRFVMFVWSVVVTMGTAIAAMLAAMNELGSTAIFSWLILAAIFASIALLFRPTRPYLTQEHK